MIDGELLFLSGERAQALVPLRLDIVAKQLAGTERKGRVEALLTANPGLAADGAYIAEGRVVVAPARPPAQTQLATVNPWD